MDSRTVWAGKRQRHQLAQATRTRLVECVGGGGRRAVKCATAIFDKIELSHYASTAHLQIRIVPMAWISPLSVVRQYIERNQQ